MHHLTASAGAPRKRRRLRTALTATLSAFLMTSGAVAVTTGSGYAAPQTGPTFSVNSTDDDTDADGCEVLAAGDDCTLREALDAANANPDANTIEFDGSVFPATITLTSSLPPISAPVTVDGGADATATVTTANPLLEPFVIVAGGDDSVISGLTISGFANAVRIEADDVVVADSVIIGNTTGVRVANGASHTRIEGNLIGVDAASTAAPNVTGVFVDSTAGAGNVIGGPTAAERNVISSNFNGILIGVLAGSGNDHATTVRNNYIGTDTTGLLDRGNSTWGILLEDHAPGDPSVIADNLISFNDLGGILLDEVLSAAVRRNVIGLGADGTTVAGNGGPGITITAMTNSTVEGNTVSANAGPGISEASGTGNFYLGNRIGTRTNGQVDATPRGNQGDGIFLTGNATVGSPVSGDRNVIAGNAGHGLVLTGSGSVVRNNRIGVDSANNAAGNSGDGIRISTPNNQIGGTASTHRNTIANNGGNGVTVVEGIGNAIQGNPIFANGGLPIDLGDDGPTPNDDGDGDGSPNHFQNSPTLAGLTTREVYVNFGDANSTEPNTDYRIEVFVSPAASPPDCEAGRAFAAAANLRTDANGNGTLTVPVTIDAGTAVSVTATRIDSGDTSEFSGCRGPAIALALPPPPDPNAGAFIFTVNETTTLPATGGGAITIRDEDVAQFNPATNTYSLVFDGSDVGMSLQAIDGLARLASNQLAFSLKEAGTIKGLGKVQPNDVIKFTGTLGVNTSGTFSLLFDGSDIGLTKASENIDALEIDGTTMYFSTTGDSSARSGTAYAYGHREDVFACTGATFGAASKCAGLSRLFDGSVAGLGTSQENVDAFSMKAGVAYFSTTGKFRVPGVTGQGNDVLSCSAPPACTAPNTWKLFFDGDLHGLESANAVEFDL